MSLAVFQWLCLPVLLVAYAVEVRRASHRLGRAFEIAGLVVSGWLAETTCIHLYAFYGYAPGWALQLAGVPLLVPLIWPMVVLSARALVNSLAPAWSLGARALAVGALVVLDASLMEVVAVGAGYWRWFEPGYASVPIIGILGWGYFAICAVFWLDEHIGPLGGRSHAWRLLSLPLVAGLGTHVLLLASWWGALRWFARGDLGAWPLVGFGIAAALFAWWALRAKATVPPPVLLVRVPAALLFVALLVLTFDAPGGALRLSHVIAIATPYLVLSVRTSWRSG